MPIRNDAPTLRLPDAFHTDWPFRSRHEVTSAGRQEGYRQSDKDIQHIIQERNTFNVSCLFIETSAAGLLSCGFHLRALLGLQCRELAGTTMPPAPHGLQNTMWPLHVSLAHLQLACLKLAHLQSFCGFQCATVKPLMSFCRVSDHLMFWGVCPIKLMNARIRPNDTGLCTRYSQNDRANLTPCTACCQCWAPVLIDI